MHGISNVYMEGNQSNVDTYLNEGRHLSVWSENISIISNITQTCYFMCFVVLLFHIIKDMKKVVLKNKAWLSPQIT